MIKNDFEIVIVYKVEDYANIAIEVQENIPIKKGNLRVAPETYIAVVKEKK